MSWTQTIQICKKRKKKSQKRSQTMNLMHKTIKSHLNGHNSHTVCPNTSLCQTKRWCLMNDSKRTMKCVTCLSSKTNTPKKSKVIQTDPLIVKSNANCRNSCQTNTNTKTIVSYQMPQRLGCSIFKVNVNIEDESLINKKLPKELLLRIFSYLDVVSLCRCAQVSKSWNILALDGSNWQRVNLFDFQTDIEGPVVENISRRCGGFLKRLCLKGCKSVTDGALRTFAQNCQNIEELNLDDCKKLTDITCQNLSVHCSKLLHLNLCSCSEISDLSLRALGEGCPNLEHINLSWCEQVTKYGIQQLVNGCTKISAFICKMCPLINDEAVIALTNSCHNLQVLNLHGCSTISDESIQSVAHNCPNMHYLCVSNCTNLTDASLLALGQGCSSLKTLEVSGCSQFTDTGFQSLTRNCHQIVMLDLEECVLITDLTLSYLSAGSSLLKELSLSHCELITDEGIRHLGTSACSSQHLTVLELDNCPLITDTALDHLITCHSLQRIELYDCQLITRAGIRRLRSHLPDLKVHAYFAPVTPPPSVAPRPRYCRCCVIL